MNFMVNLAGLIGAIYLLFEFTTNGNVFLMLLGIMFVVIASVAAMNSFDFTTGKRRKR